MKQKKRHISTATHYKKKHKFLLGMLYCFQFFFWVLAIILLITLHHWIMVLSLVVTKIIVQYIIMGISAKKLGEKDLFLLIPILEVFLIAMQLTIFIKNLNSKKNHWK